MYFREHLIERGIGINTFVNLYWCFIQGVSGANHLYCGKLGGIFSTLVFSETRGKEREINPCWFLLLIMLRDGSSSLRRNLGVFWCWFQFRPDNWGKVNRERKKGGGTNISASYPFSLIREKRGKKPNTTIGFPSLFSDNDGFYSNFISYKGKLIFGKKGGRN